VITQGVDHDTGGYAGTRWHLHTSGAGFAAVAVGWVTRGADRKAEVPRQFLVDDEDLVIELTQALAALVEHAVVRCGAGPIGIVSAGMLARDEALRPAPIHLVHQRGMFGRDTEGPGATRIPLAEHTVDLAAIQASPTELLVAARILLTDLMQALGRAECWQIDAEGRLRRRYFRRPRLEQIIIPWAEAVGVEMTEETPTN
jgi:hypothetical protein